MAGPSLDFRLVINNIVFCRRLLHDDGYGVGEPLNETETFNGVETGLVAVGTHRVLAGSTLNQVCTVYTSREDKGV